MMRTVGCAKHLVMLLQRESPCINYHHLQALSFCVSLTPATAPLRSVPRRTGGAIPAVMALSDALMNHLPPRTT
jgi:hypothetical protein